MKSILGTNYRFFSFISALLLAVSSARAVDSAKPFLHPLFADHMVLQRGMPDPIWGWTDPGATVTVRVKGKTYTATADASGKWLAKIGPFKAGGPYTITISGPQEVTLSDVLVGDVWLCSGQSNMEMGIANGKNAAEEIKNANYPNIRLFGVPKVIRNQPQPLFGPMENGQPAWPKGRVQWMPCTPESIQIGDWAGFTAVGYFFGRQLATDLKAPIGLIQSAWGGTVCEAWVGSDFLEQMSDFKDAIAQVKSTDTAEKGKNPNIPTVLYNGMIAPLTPMALKGAIWYQGESNAGRGKQYRTLLATMIRDWRAHFSAGDFPFFIVQLAGFTDTKPEPGESGWAEIREAQQWAAAEVGHSATASAVDIGEAKDIHPKNKQEVGRRLALCAEAIAYGKRIESEGPTFQKMEIKGDKAVIHFSHRDGGLEIKGDSLKGFAIAEADGHFVWADARIDGKNAIVSSAKVARPVAVRYAWADNPEANLYNKAGLPANPFRTDMPK
jgi:sialate O-acetylesterase